MGIQLRITQAKHAVVGRNVMKIDDPLPLCGHSIPVALWLEF